MLHEGSRGFLRGLLPACALTLPSSALIFGFKNAYSCVWDCMIAKKIDGHSYETKGHLITGLLAGISSKVIVYPLDVIKKRLQVQGMSKNNYLLNTKPHYKGFSDCLMTTIRNEGVLGLYRGIFPAVIKAGIANSIYFTIYNEVIYFMKLVKL